MGELDQTILNNYKEALKAKDTVTSSVLNFLRSSLIYEAKEKRKDQLDDSEVIAVIKKQVKQRKDSIEQFTKGNRVDLAEKETKELEILTTYLPKQLDPGKLNGIIDEVIQALNATSPKDMGTVIKEVLERSAGAADGKQVSELVKARLMPKK
ncbi:GatB/YqeY domain-containing protein [Candidatus Omnitrophota bacterium]